MITDKIHKEMVRRLVKKEDIEGMRCLARFDLDRLKHTIERIAKCVRGEAKGVEK